jgi:hypothetical protein
MRLSLIALVLLPLVAQAQLPTPIGNEPPARSETRSHILAHITESTVFVSLTHGFAGSWTNGFSEAVSDNNPIYYMHEWHTPGLTVEGRTDQKGIIPLHNLIVLYNCSAFKGQYGDHAATAYKIGQYGANQAILGFPEVVALAAYSPAHWEAQMNAQNPWNVQADGDVGDHA